MGLKKATLKSPIGEKKDFVFFVSRCSYYVVLFACQDGSNNLVSENEINSSKPKHL